MKFQQNCIKCGKPADPNDLYCIPCRIEGMDKAMDKSFCPAFSVKIATINKPINSKAYQCIGEPFHEGEHLYDYDGKPFREIVNGKSVVR